MLAHLADELRDGVPFPLASGIIQLVEVAPGLGRIWGWLWMGKTATSVSGEDKRRRGGWRACWRLTAIELDGDRRRTTGDGRGKGGIATVMATGWRCTQDLKGTVRIEPSHERSS